ncbi:MAG: hypothetical protein Q8Q09_14685 [Deltaproteobacteria bacterium]|nr:hypothetical protein [Deltaproteobacteria bacterium]
MPLLAFVLLNAAVGLLTAWAARNGLRASARGPWSTDAARLLVAHELLTAVPALGYCLLRAPDWSVSYLVGAGRVPSIVVGAVLVLNVVVAIASFALAGRWVVTHRADWALKVAVGLGSVAVIAPLALRNRVRIVTTFVHFRGGLDPQPGLTVSGPALYLAIGSLWLLAAAVMIAGLRQRDRALTIRNRG